MSALVNSNQRWDRGTDLVLYFKYAVGASALTAIAPTDFADWDARAAVEVVESGTQVEDVTQVATASKADESIVLGVDGSITVSFPWTDELDDKFTSEASLHFKYDVILEDTSGKRFKLAAGTITVEDSVTVWPTTP